MVLEQNALQNDPNQGDAERHCEEQVVAGVRQDDEEHDFMGTESRFQRQSGGHVVAKGPRIGFVVVPSLKMKLFLWQKFVALGHKSRHAFDRVMTYNNLTRRSSRKPRDTRGG